VASPAIGAPGLGDGRSADRLPGAGGMQPFLQDRVVLGEVPDALLERGVPGSDPLRAVLGPFVYQVADLAQ